MTIKKSIFNCINYLCKSKVRLRIKMKKLNDYMEIPYCMEIIEDKEEGGFVAFYPDLPGCITCGETVEIAVANALDAKKAWIEAMMEEEH